MLCQVDGFERGIAHDALEARGGSENTPDDGDTAQRLGSETHSFPADTCLHLAYVLIEQVEVEVSKRHGIATEYLFIIGVVMHIFARANRRSLQYLHRNCWIA